MTDKGNLKLVIVDEAVHLPEGKRVLRVERDSDVGSSEPSITQLIGRLLQLEIPIILHVTRDLDILLSEDCVRINKGKIDILITDFLGAWQGEKTASEFVRANRGRIIEQNVRLIVLSGFDESSFDAQQGSEEIRKVLGESASLFVSWVGKSNTDSAERIAQYVTTSTQETKQISREPVADLEIQKEPQIRPSIEKLVVDLSSLKHRIAHYFLSIDIDLQGLRETKFDQEFWKQAVKDKAISYYTDRLREALHLIYSEGNSVRKILSEVLNLKPLQVSEDDFGPICDYLSPNSLEICTKLVDQEMDSQSWKEISEGITRKRFEKQPQSFKVAVLFAALEKRNRRMVESLLESFNFNKWFSELDEAIDKLRSDLEPS